MSRMFAGAPGPGLLYPCVFLTGAAVMVIELIGTRIIAPFYGASLYVWSSLISTTMIALALGYFIGGRWADRSNSAGLPLIVASAGLLTLLIPWVTRPVLLATDSLGLRTGAFVSALLLFLPSLAFLGMVGPFAIKLATRHLQGVGSSSGSVYAVSTLGSVIGTILLGFFLFPLWGSREILIGTGVILFLLAGVLMLIPQMRLPSGGTSLPSIALILIGCGLLPYVIGQKQGFAAASGFRVQSEQESLYGWVRVIDQPAKDLRLLTSDASAIGAASIVSGANRLGYQKIVELVPALRPGMREALLIGQGAGHMVATLARRFQIATDTIEIDPMVAAAATEYFAFAPTGHTIIGDARYEIRRLNQVYNLIILDCFTGGAEPSYLLTRETLDELKGLLHRNGLLMLNFVGFADRGNNPALASVAKTIAEVFPHQSVFIAEPGREFNDFVFVATSEPLAIEASGLSASEQKWLAVRRVSVNPDFGQILSDNFNPIEKLQIRKAEKYRHVLVDWLGTDILVR